MNNQENREIENRNIKVNTKKQNWHSPELRKSDIKDRTESIEGTDFIAVYTIS